MRLKPPPIFIFSLILLVGLLASTNSHAQKKFSIPKIPKIHFGLPHFKNPFAKDSTNKSFNNKRWFKYQKEALYTKNENAMPIAVGYTDFDENIRDLQLLGKLPTDNSLTIRPYILPKSVTYDSLLKAIDPSLKNNGHLVHKKHFDLQLLPFNYLQKYNSHHPYGWNDGPLSFSKGYQYLVSGGVYMHWRNIHLTLRPEYFHTASDKYEYNRLWGEVNPSLNKLIFGQSNIRIDLGPINIGAGANNMWRGPGIKSSLLMSNNAQGFNHFYIGTKKPINILIGKLDFNTIGGILTQNQTQGFENKNLRTYFSDGSIRQYHENRYLNISTIVVEPFFLKNVYFGLIRVFQNYENKTPKNLFNYYLPTINPFFKKNYNDDILGIDQILSFFTKIRFNKEHAEVYFEYGYNDSKKNFRELLLDNSHSSASIFGFSKNSWINNKTYFNISFESTRMAQTPSFLIRNAGNWYEHSPIIEGYTNENQIMGSGSGYGNNVLTIDLSLNNNFNKFGLCYAHIMQNPTLIASQVSDFYLNPILWNDHVFSFKLKQKVKNILFNCSFNYVTSKNYLWKENNNKNDLYLFFNTIYIW